MATVRYTTIDGEIVAEKRAGVRKTYMPDPLGLTVALLDNSQQQTDTLAYWPYGEERARTGTTPTPFRAALCSCASKPVCTGLCPCPVVPPLIPGFGKPAWLHCVAYRVGVLALFCTPPPFPPPPPGPPGSCWPSGAAV